MRLMSHIPYLPSETATPPSVEVTQTQPANPSLTHITKYKHTPWGRSPP